MTAWELHFKGQLISKLEFYISKGTLVTANMEERTSLLLLVSDHDYDLLSKLYTQMKQSQKFLFYQ